MNRISLEIITFSLLYLACFLVAPLEVKLLKGSLINFIISNIIEITLCLISYSVGKGIGRRYP